jgi:hypothetical protein
MGWLQHLKDLTTLKTIALSKTKVTDKGMVHLEGLKLEALTLVDTVVTDAKAAELQKKFGPLAFITK